MLVKTVLVLARGSFLIFWPKASEKSKLEMCCCRDKEELKITFTLLGVQEEDMMVYDDLTAAEIREKLGQLQPVIAPR